MNSDTRRKAGHHNNLTPPEGERAKLAGEVTEGDRALWESLCRLNACAANVEDYQEESVALIAKFRASVAVAEAESKVAALEALVVRLSESLSKARLFQQKTAGHHIWNPEEQELFADLVAACSLVPADLAECVCVKRSEWYGSGFPEMKREVEQLRYDVSKLEVENKRLVALLNDEAKKIRWNWIDREYAVDDVEEDCENACYDLSTVNVVRYAVAVEIPDEFYVWWEDNADSARPDVQQLWGPFKTREEAEAQIAALQPAPKV